MMALCIYRGVTDNTFIINCISFFEDIFVLAKKVDPSPLLNAVLCNILAGSSMFPEVRIKPSIVYNELSILLVYLL